MKQNLLRKLYVEELRDLYSAESQLLRALPKIARSATTPNLRESIQGHLRQTREHLARLEGIFEALDESPRGKHCKGIEGLIKEGSMRIAEHSEPRELDTRLISAVQHVEHYEMAGYGCVRTYATLLGENEAALLLEQTLIEAKETDAKLSRLAETIIIEAMELEDSSPAEKGFRRYLKKSAAV